MDFVFEEVAKAVITHLTSGGLTKAGALLHTVLGKIATPPLDQAKLTELVVAEAARDPQWEQLLRVALEDTGENVAAGTPAPSRQLFDRTDVLRAVNRPDAYLFAGPTGVGKTELVRNIVQLHREHYRNGDVYLDLDTCRTGDVLDVDEAWRVVLHQFGITDLDETRLRDQYHSVLRRHQVVFVLENVQSAEEVTTFSGQLPASCLRLVTTRRLSADLQVRYLAALRLGALEEPAGRDYLAAICGEPILGAEREATEDLLALAEHTPLAIEECAAELLRQAGARLPVRRAVDRMRATGTSGALGMVKAFRAETFQKLSTTERQLFRMLGAHPGPDFTEDTASALAGADVHDEFGVLREYGLLVNEAPGRFRRLRFADDANRDPELFSAADEDAAQERLLFYCCDLAVRADLLRPGRLRLYPGRDSTPAAIPGYSTVDWLDEHRGLLFALVQQASLRGNDAQACQLCGVLELLVLGRGHLQQYLEANEYGIRSALRLGDPALLARMHAISGRVLTLCGKFDAAAERLRTAEELLDDTNLVLAASVHEFWGRWHEERTESNGQYRYAEAITAFRRAVAFDERAAVRSIEQADAVRSMAIHIRMLANVLGKDGQPSAAKSVLADAPSLAADDTGNLARWHMVAAKVELPLVGPAPARAALSVARRLTAEAQINQYNAELDEIDGDIACAEGDLEKARWFWRYWAAHYVNIGHSRANRLLDKLSRLPRPAIPPR